MTRNVRRNVDRDGREKFGAEGRSPPTVPPHGEYFPNGEQFGIDALGKQARPRLYRRTDTTARN